jgi:hypothetical protein
MVFGLSSPDFAGAIICHRVEGNTFRGTGKSPRTKDTRNAARKREAGLSKEQGGKRLRTVQER